VNSDFELMKILEGVEYIAYDCTAGKRTVGVGFNMESYGARKVWDKLEIKEDFDKVFYKEEFLSELSMVKLFEHTWKWCQRKAEERAKQLGLNYSSMPEYKKFILADIVYNTGSINKWRKVLLNKDPESVIYEARRNPKYLMDSRVAKIAYYYRIISTLEEAKQLGLTYAKHLI
jgi:GH24 family phage-related lysozyme (muramidase)